MRGVLVKIALATAILSPAAAQAQQQSRFDLICVGSAESLKGTTRAKAPFNQILHIDLGAGQYCVDNCQAILPIKASDPLSITLVDVPRHGGPMDMRMDRRTIDRRTGAYEIVDFDAGKLSMLTVKATCSSKPFTPFPKTKF